MARRALTPIDHLASEAQRITAERLHERLKVPNERDEIGDDLPPDYLTSVQEGGFYGWPYSYFGKHVDERVTPQRIPARTVLCGKQSRAAELRVQVLADDRGIVQHHPVFRDESRNAPERIHPHHAGVTGAE